MAGGVGTAWKLQVAVPLLLGSRRLTAVTVSPLPEAGAVYTPEAVIWPYWADQETLWLGELVPLTTALKVWGWLKSMTGSPGETMTAVTVGWAGAGAGAGTGTGGAGTGGAGTGGAGTGGTAAALGAAAPPPQDTIKAHCPARNAQNPSTARENGNFQACLQQRLVCPMASSIRMVEHEFRAP